MHLPSPDTKIAVAMSGGTDSSAVAALLAEQGCSIMGLTAHTWKDFASADIDRARKVAEYLGIEHTAVDLRGIFSEQVVKPFIQQYQSGRTPSPCVICNEHIKFGALLEHALRLSCSTLATGHYANIEEIDGAFHLLKAKDPVKDQSYFLHRLRQDQLQRIVFPLGDMIKADEVLPYVTEKELPARKSIESQDLCFIPGGNHGSFMKQFADAVQREGRIVNTTGKELGTHTGIFRYTVGQRKGLGVASTEPLYVVRIDPVSRDVVLGTREEAMRSECRIEDVNWISGNPPPAGSYRIRVRYQHDEAPAEIAMEDGQTVVVRFEEPQFAVSPGQAGVIYDGNEVLGGGWIE